MSQEKKPAAEPDVMEKLVSLCKRRGFVFQSSEIYGGLKSCYDYGPLGAELKRNVKAEWWRRMVHEREDVVGLDASIIMSPQVWKASGHLAGFSDPVVDCKICKERFRADKAPKMNVGALDSPREFTIEITAPDKESPKSGKNPKESPPKASLASSAMAEFSRPRSPSAVPSLARASWRSPTPHPEMSRRQHGIHATTIVVRSAGAPSSRTSASST